MKTLSTMQYFSLTEQRKQKTTGSQTYNQALVPCNIFIL
jgi:hypothetical protein